MVVYGDRFTEEQDQVLAVWGNGFKLVPLDRHNYPGVFVNVGARSGIQTFENDIVHMPAPGITVENNLLPNVTRQEGRCALGQRHYLEVAIAYDHTFCNLFSGEALIANAVIQAMVDESNVAWTRDTCVEVVLVHLESNCQRSTDPYRNFNNFPSFRPCSVTRFPEPCSTGEFLLYSFTTFWNTNRPAVQRDAAYLVTGFRDGTSTAGIAFIGTACGNFGYGWIEGSNFLTFAHEVGHTLSAQHTSQGIMVASGISSSRFNSVSQRQITSYVDRVSCITTGAPVCDATCAGACVDNKCITGNNVMAPLVPCKPLPLAYYCVEDRFGFNFGVNCPAPYNFALVANDPDDPTTFCCNPPASSTTAPVAPRSRPLFGLRLRTPAGTRTYFDWLGDETSFITTETILETTINQACMADVVVGPTPTSTPKTQTPSQTPSVTPTPSANTCGNTFASGFTFDCAKKRRLTRFRSGNIGPVTLFISQKFGVFTTFVKTGRNARIMNFGRIISTDPSLNAADVIALPVSMPETRPTLERSSDPFSLTVPDGRANCCGSTVWVYVNIEICNANTAACFSWDRRMQYRMACKRVCRRTGTVVPFSPSRRCPSCDES